MTHEVLARGDDRHAAEIDFRASMPGLRFLAGIAWPHDECRRRQLLAAATGLGLHHVKQPAPENQRMCALADEAVFDSMGG